MKRLLCMLLIFTMVLAGAFALCSCEEKHAVIPEGYTKFENGDISFAYPSDWKKTEGSATMLMNPTGAGNNITVVYEAKTDIYEDSTEAKLEELFAQSMNAYGMSISDFKLFRTKNDYVDKIIKLTFTTVANSVSMKQTVFIVTAGDRTYSITITEATADQDLVDTVFDTLEITK